LEFNGRFFPQVIRAEAKDKVIDIRRSYRWDCFKSLENTMI